MTEGCDEGDSTGRASHDCRGLQQREQAEHDIEMRVAIDWRGESRYFTCMDRDH